MNKRILSKTDFTGISLAEMRNYLKFEDDNTSEDLLIITLINAAVERIEAYCNIALRSINYEIIFDEFDIDEGRVILPIAPFSQLSNVYNIDGYGTETEDTTAYQSGGTIKEIYSALYVEGYKMKVKYTAGYGITTEGYETESIPEIVKLAIYDMVSLWYEDRGVEKVLPKDVRKSLNAISYTSWI